jgi:hypothetical protein
MQGYQGCSGLLEWDAADAEQDMLGHSVEVSAGMHVMVQTMHS